MSTATVAENAKVAPAPLASQYAGAERKREHHRDEDSRDAVGEAGPALPDCAPRDEPCDLRKRRIGADTLRSHDEPPPALTVARRDLVTRADLDRHALPVSSDESTAEWPSTTTSSVATFSPGAHDEDVADRGSPIGTSRSAPSGSRSRTSFAPSPASARSAARRLRALGADLE